MRPHHPTARPRLRPRRAVLAVLAAAAVLAGCSHPTTSDNSLVVHVVVEDCATDEGVTLLAYHRYDERWMKLRDTGLCGAAPTSRHFDGKPVQVWKSTSDWTEVALSTTLQLGHRTLDDHSWVITTDDALRIDHRHVLIGAIVMAHSDAQYMPAVELPAASEALLDRQGCERKILRCGTDWERADPLTFSVAS